MKTLKLTGLTRHLEAILRVVRPSLLRTGIGPRSHVAVRMARLAENGIIRPPHRPLPIDALTASPPKPRKSVLQALLDERSELPPP
jgi:hypothetical protein